MKGHRGGQVKVHDLIVVTNVFPYLSDVDLVLALTNMSRMLARGGTLLHNERAIWIHRAPE